MSPFSSVNLISTTRVSPTLCLFVCLFGFSFSMLYEQKRRTVTHLGCEGPNCFFRIDNALSREEEASSILLQSTSKAPVEERWGGRGDGINASASYLYISDWLAITHQENSKWQPHRDLLFLFLFQTEGEKNEELFLLIELGEEKQDEKQEKDL